MSETTLVRAERAELAERDGQSPTALVQLALERQADPATLERLMALQERWEVTQARKALVAALTAFKARCPSVVAKDGKVDYQPAGKARVHYRHATLGQILDGISPHLAGAELSVTYEADQAKGGVTVVCIVEHVRGGAKRVSLTCPVDASGGKNAIQQIGSAVTYLKRYTLGLALGLAESDDDDGQASGPRRSEPAQQRKTSAPHPFDDEPADGALQELQALLVDATDEQRQWVEWKLREGSAARDLLGRVKAARSKAAKKQTKTEPPTAAMLERLGEYADHPLLTEDERKQALQVLSRHADRPVAMGEAGAVIGRLKALIVEREDPEPGEPPIDGYDEKPEPGAFG